MSAQHPTGSTMLDSPDDIDPAVAEMVVHIRDRFGLRGLRAAARMIDGEIRVAEDALRELTPE
jgi:hypothetical protein